MVSAFVDIQAWDSFGNVLASSKGFLVGQGYARTIISCAHMKHLAPEGSQLFIINNMGAPYPATAYAESDVSDLACIWSADNFEGYPALMLSGNAGIPASQAVKCSTDTEAVDGTYVCTKLITGIGPVVYKCECAVAAGYSGSPITRNDTGSVIGVMSAFDGAGNILTVSIPASADWIKSTIARNNLSNGPVLCNGDTDYAPSSGFFANS